MKSQKILSDYRAAVERLYGKERLAASDIYYLKGWFYVAIARIAPDGSIGIWFNATAYRAKDIISMTAELNRKALGYNS